ncbi:MAG: DUF2029 domain-containing protein [Chloroflexi bacterium]|nr:DUF2029 domain-containing protein [Chloroflexota bacterium]
MMQKLFAGTLLLILLIYALVAPIPIPRSTGIGDFRAYWSAAYLLADSQNFADPDLLYATEQEHTDWTGTFSVVTWNPPWLLTLLLPFALVSFWRAAWLWMLTNILLVFVGSVMIWQTTAVSPKSRRWGPLAPLFGLLFTPTLVALHMGQINTLVFFGIASYLYFYQKERPFIAGAALVLTLVKPHLVYITIPLLFLDALRKREWRMIAGTGVMLVGLTAVVFLLRPDFLIDYSSTVSGGNLLAWETPTLGGILALLFGWQGFKLMGILFLPLSIWLWWQYKDQITHNSLVAISLLVSVITAPFGWNYDVIVLLMPLLQLIVWLFEGKYGRLQTIFIATLLILVDWLVIRQRTRGMSELYLFWFPLSLAAIYLWARIQHFFFGRFVRDG